MSGRPNRPRKGSVPTLILMDLRLPGIDGYAALRQLRKDARTAPIRVVALTAQAMKGDERTALEAGFDAYISKPIDTRTLCQTVARLLSSEGAGHEPTERAGDARKDPGSR